MNRLTWVSARVSEALQKPPTSGTWKRYLPHAVTLAVLIVGITSWAVSRPPMSPAASPERAATAAPTGIVTGPFSFDLATVRVAEAEVARRTRIQGKVVPAPQGEVQISAPAPGFVSYGESAPRVGQVVEQGEPLVVFQYHFELHDAVHLLNERWVVVRELLRAERERVRTHVEYERLQTIADADGASRVEVLEARTRARVADAEAQTWTRRLELHDRQIQSSDPNRQPLLAPVTGTIAEVSLPQGQLAHEGDPLVTLVDLSEVWIEATAPLAAAGWIGKTATAWIVVPGSGGEPRQAQKRAVVPVVDGDTRMLRLQFSVPNPDRALRFDMSVDLYVDRGESFRAVSIPKAAIITREQQSFVFVPVAPDQYALREVRPVADDIASVPVEGLQPGDEVVVDGHEQLWSVLEYGEGTRGAQDSGAVEIAPEMQQRHGIAISEIERQPLNRTLVVPGIVRPVPTAVAEVVSPIWGRIEHAGRPLTVGDTVQKDQTLATVVLELNAAERHLLLDRTLEVEGALEQASARADQARDEHQRALQLIEARAALEQEARWREEILASATREEDLVLEQMERQKRVAKIRDPNRRRITAPIGGTIMAVHFVPGQLVPEESYQRLFTIMDLRQVWVEAEVFERDLAALQHITESVIQAPLERPRPARMVTLGATVSPQTRRLPVWFSVDNRDGLLRPGMPVDLRLVLESSAQVISVPAGAVLTERGESIVFMATSPTRFERRAVQTGRREGGRIEILRGLQSKARIATRGVYYLRAAPPSVDDGHGSHPH